MIGSATTFLKSQVNVFREFEHRGQSNYRLDLYRASSIPIRRLHHSLRGTWSMCTISYRASKVPQLAAPRHSRSCRTYVYM